MAVAARGDALQYTIKNSPGGAPMLHPVPTVVISVLISLTVISFWL
jgi:hypothetical protein